MIFQTRPVGRARQVGPLTPRSLGHVIPDATVRRARCVARVGWAVAVLALPACSGDSPSPVMLDDTTTLPPRGTGATIEVDISKRFQTMTGWQATAYAAQDSAGFPAWKNELFDRAVKDGINRLRVDLRSGLEHAQDSYLDYKRGIIPYEQFRCIRYATVNDNSDPFVLNKAGFKFSLLDSIMTNVVVPVRNRLIARGESLYLGLTYIAFTQQMCNGGSYDHRNPEEYAEYVLAMMQHVRDRYGFDPDAWEVINEPDNTEFWGQPAVVVAGLIAADRRLKQHGFNTRFIGPSNMNTGNAVSFTDALLASPQARAALGQIAYHRYGGATEANVKALGDRSRSSGIPSGMSEHIGSGIEDLFQDVILGNTSTWSQFVLGGPGQDNGGHYYDIVGTSVRTTSRMLFLRHVFRHVRLGAQRIEAVSSNPALSPLAFRNANGRLVVVVRATDGATFTVGGLTPGTYSVGLETSGVSDGVGPAVEVGSDGVASVSIPAAGVLVLYRAT